MSQETIDALNKVLGKNEADKLRATDALVERGFPREMVEEAGANAQAMYDKIIAYIEGLLGEVTDTQRLELMLFLGATTNLMDDNRHIIQFMWRVLIFIVNTDNLYKQTKA